MPECMCSETMRAAGIYCAADIEALERELVLIRKAAQNERDLENIQSARYGQGVGI